ncbi:unnamed protein product [Rhizophagus irregularis]|nr:unnamed protein product [Rhizophagus irregularis]
MDNIENKNEWINWIEEAIDKEHIKYYEYKEFNKFQEIGTGSSGKVLNNVTVKEIVHELKIHRKVDYHDNIIRCHGITSTEYHNNNNYMLVMEYANSACAVSCLHNEGIIHRDLHSGEQYDVDLILEISQGLRETVVPGTPEEYVKIYTKCWDREPDNRPTIYQVVECLNAKTDVMIENHQFSNGQELNNAPLNIDNTQLQGELSNNTESRGELFNNTEPQGKMSKLIQNFNEMNTEEIDTIAEN